MGIVANLRGRLKIRVRLMLLTSGIVFFSVTVLSLVVILQYQRLLVEKTLDVCKNLSINLADQAREELLLSEEVFAGTRQALLAVKKSKIEGLLGSYVVSQKKKGNDYGAIVAHTDESEIGKIVGASDLAFFNSINELGTTEISGKIRFAFPLFVNVPRSEPIRLGTAVFEFDRAVIYSPVDRIRNSILIVSLFLMLAALIIAYLLSARLSMPIEKLAHAASEIAEGKLGTTVDISTAGEIGQLGNTFNNMSRSLKESEKIRTEQAAIKRELEIARGIQMAVLPPNGVVGPYSFHGFMETADEVGGDYYDSIEVRNNKKSHYWFFIGDVSGHGLRAGLTMLMAQTAIHSAMEVNPGMDPQSAFLHVNEVLFENIRRLKERKYMTATFLRADSSGDFVAAGLHQDFLIYRASKKKIETLPSEGFWLGIDRSVKKETVRVRLKLGRGDILFLFTDGLVESMNVRKEMFGQEKVAEIIRKSGEQELDVIERKIMWEFRSHCGQIRPADDITFAMVRRNR
ncbi:MAG: SpoIIE family protein phosphatase [Spirochaetia bacterium]|nr:SpoIIE family protein phosphatase [Spirochaetia bacterium]